MPRQVVQPSNASIRFNGIDNINLGAKFNYPNDFTISTNVKFANVLGVQRLFSVENCYGFGVTGARQFLFTTYNKADHGSALASAKVEIGLWYNLAMSFSATNVIKFYINGALVDTITASLGAANTGTPTASISGQLASQFLNGPMDSLAIWNRTLTDSEIAQVATAGLGSVPTGQTGRWMLDEGAGTAIGDASGNANTGTLSSSTLWNADTPSTARKQVGANLVANGDMEYAPPFVAATTGKNWIDGTVAGSASNSLFNWYRMTSVTGSAALTPTAPNSGLYSLELTSSGAGASRVGTTDMNVGTGAVDSNVDKIIPIKSSTAYTITCRASFTAGDNVALFKHEYNGSRSYVGGSQVSSVDTAAGGYRTLTLNFTSGASTAGLGVFVVHTANATGQIARFDDISLVETTPVGRLAVGDFKASLGFDGAVSYVEGVAIASITGTGTRTVSAWINPNGAYSSQSIFGTGANSLGAMMLLSYDGVNNRVTMSTFGTDANSGTGSLLVKTGWHHVAAVIGNADIRMYIDGVQKGTVATLANTINISSSVWRIGRRFNSTEYFQGKIADVRVWNTALTAAEMAQLATAGISTQTPVGFWKLNEGAGTTALDSSGNANHGVITGATYSSDTPSKARKIVGGNKVENGSFEYYPPTNTAQTTSNWIDGTASGTANPTLFNWYRRGVVGSTTALFDTANAHSGTCAMKLSTITTGSRIFVYSNASGTGQPLTTSGAAIVSRPSTSYTCSYWMKTNVVSGTATTGAKIELAKKDISGTSVEIFGADSVITATAWTLYSFTFTTNSSVGNFYLVPTLQINGQDGVGTLIMDAYFDNIILTETTPVVRAIA